MLGKPQTTATRIQAANPTRIDDADDGRRFELAVSSETPVERMFGSEILLHEREAIRMEFFGGGRAPLLMDHDSRDQIGVVESVRLDADKVLRAVVRFGKSARASEIMADVADGIRLNTSVQYRIYAYDEMPKRAGYRITDWEPLEVSIVSIPADATVGVGRNTDLLEKRKMPETETDASAEATRIVEAARAEATIITERARAVQNCRELAARHQISAEFDAWLNADASRAALPAAQLLAEWRGHAITKIGDKPIADVETIGLTGKEVRRFSLVKLMRAIADPQRTNINDAKFELEACDAAAEAAKRNEVATKGHRLPAEIMLNWDTSRREYNTADDAALVPTEHLAGSFIDLLRKQMSVLRAGATMLTGLSGNIEIPKQLTGATAAWVNGEGGNATASEGTFGQIAMSPKDVAVYTDMSRRMMQQSSPDIEGIARRDILFGMRSAIDLAALEGSGSAGVPRGIYNTVGINKPTGWAGAVPTWAEVVAMETALDDDEALDGNLAYIGRTNLRGALKTAPKEAGFPTYIMPDSNTLNGYAYHASNQGTNGRLYFGAWNNLLIGFWSGLDLQVDTSGALALKGAKRIIAFQTCDVACRYPEAFAWNAAA